MTYSKPRPPRPRPSKPPTQSFDTTSPPHIHPSYAPPAHPVPQPTMAEKQQVMKYPPAPLSPATIAELPWFFLLLIFAVISEKERQESGQRERSMKEEMETMKEKIRELEGAKKELEAWKEEETKWRENEEKQKDAAAKKIRGLEDERVTLKRAAEEREESHHRQLALSHQNTFRARLRADHAESALRSTKLSFELEQVEWEDEKGKLVRDLEKVRRENKGIVYLRARIATAEAGMRFWEKEYRGKDKDGGLEGLASVDVGKGNA
ncbi:hypothetical protein ONZ45_g6922 [Pleurotus djamor]|nr:hypothetical protein ONZ45_g6922 [Pleurotus djamor]